LTRKRKRPQRGWSGNRRRTTIYVDADLLDLVKELAKVRNISLCDWVEEAMRLKAGIEGLVKISEHRKGGLTVKSIIVHKVERLRRQTPDEQVVYLGRLLCPKCGSDKLRHKPYRRHGIYDGSFRLCLKCGHYFSRFQ